MWDILIEFVSINEEIFIVFLSFLQNYFLRIDRVPLPILIVAVNIIIREIYWYFFPFACITHLISNTFYRFLFQDVKSFLLQFRECVSPCILYKLIENFLLIFFRFTCNSAHGVSNLNAINIYALNVSGQINLTKKVWWRSNTCGIKCNESCLTNIPINWPINLCVFMYTVQLPLNPRISFVNYKRILFFVGYSNHFIVPSNKDIFFRLFCNVFFSIGATNMNCIHNTNTNTNTHIIEVNWICKRTLHHEKQIFICRFLLRFVDYVIKRQTKVKWQWNIFV